MFNTVNSKANHPNGLTWIDNSKCVFFSGYTFHLYLLPRCSRKTGMSWSFWCFWCVFYSRILSSCDDVNSSSMALGIPQVTTSMCCWLTRCVVLKAFWSARPPWETWHDWHALTRFRRMFSCLWKNVVQVWKICMRRLDASMNSVNAYNFFVYWLTRWYIHTCAHT